MSLLKRIPLFRPFVPPEARAAVDRVLSMEDSPYIGQGPVCDQFEAAFAAKFGGPAVAVNSCTSALHLAYLLAGIGPGDEVIAPLFTCTATNEPLLYCGAKIRFCDVGAGSLLMDMDHCANLITHRTKAIVTVDYGGGQCFDPRALAGDLAPAWISDRAQALGAAYPQKASYACYSFQAVKHITTGDGGMLVLPEEQVAKAKRMRWFGIDRAAKLGGAWENDIREVGYKYQMTDIAASMGLAALPYVDRQILYRKEQWAVYRYYLAGEDGIRILDTDPGSACWLMTVAVERRADLKRKLAERGIDSDQVHYRNDRYSIFSSGVKRGEFPNMDAMDPLYLCLPIGPHVSIEDVQRICDVIKEGW